jgi:hypothetical protein
VADIFLDEFNGPPGSVVGHDAGGGHLWAAPFAGGSRLLLSGFGSLMPPVGYGDAQIRIPELAGQSEYEIEMRFGGPLSDIIEVEYGAQSVGDLMPGNFYINISNTGCSVRWYTEDPNQNFTWPESIVEDTTILFRFTSGSVPRLSVFFEGNLAFSYGASDRTLDDHIWKMATSSDSNMNLLSFRAGTPTPPEPSDFWTAFVGTSATVSDPAPPPEA